MSNLCMACPKGEKNPTEFLWHPGSVGCYRDCEECLRRNLPKSVERLDDYERHKFQWKGASGFVSGYATPVDDPEIKILTEKCLDGYLRLKEYNHE